MVGGVRQGSWAADWGACWGIGEVGIGEGSHWAVVSGVEEGGIIQGLTESENRLFQGGDIPREPKSA